MPSTRRHHHHVYVVELDDRVWNELRFRKANPDHPLGKPLVYVGMTGTDPDLRFDKHKAGFKASFTSTICIVLNFSITSRGVVPPARGLSFAFSVTCRQ